MKLKFHILHKWKYGLTDMHRSCKKCPIRQYRVWNDSGKSKWFVWKDK